MLPKDGSGSRGFARKPPMPSTRLKILQDRVQLLRRCLLPDPFEIPGTYPDETMIRVRAVSYRVLAHAEIETFFEDRVIEIAKAALASWKSARRVSRPMLCLLGFSGHSMQLPPATLTAKSDNQRKTWPELIDVTHRLTKAASDFVGLISKENHGVREKNILSMLLPIGFDNTLIDAVFLADIDEFGQRRGEAAHSSTTAHVQQGIDPKDEHDRVMVLLGGLTSFDEQLDILLLDAAGSCGGDKGNGSGADGVHDSEGVVQED
jgi:hypothetical protein